MFAVQHWDGLGVGHYSSQTRINAGVQFAATIQVIFWAIIEVRRGALKLGQTWQRPGNHK